MPGKVARTGGGSKTQPPKKTTSSSSSSKTSKTSSSSSVKKATPPPAKPKNVDKVDFGKPKPKVDAGTYKPAPPKPAPAPPRPLTLKDYTAEQKKSAPPKPKQEDYNPMQMDLKTRAKINEIGRQYDKEHPRQNLHDVENAAALWAGGATYAGGGSKMASFNEACKTGGSCTFVEKIVDEVVPFGKEILDKTNEILGDIFRGTTMNMLDEDNPLG